MTFIEHPHGYTIAVHPHRHIVALVRETLDGDYFWTVIPTTGGAPVDCGYAATRELGEALAADVLSTT